MRLTRIYRDDEAVSEVVGVILMVAITVLLASVVGAMVLGLGGETQTTPQASFSWDWDGTAGALTITHDTGENIKATELFVRGDDGAGTSIDTQWTGDTSVKIGGTSAVASGDTMTLTSPSSAYELRVVWQSQSGENSATLGQDTGPDA